MFAAFLISSYTMFIRFDYKIAKLRCFENIGQLFISLAIHFFRYYNDILKEHFSYIAIHGLYTIPSIGNKEN